MPIHWPTVYAHMDAKLQAWQAQQEAQRQALEATRAEMAAWAARPGEAAALVQRLLRDHPRLAERYRLAWPLDDRPWDTGHCPDATAEDECPRPTAMPPGQVWAADGSQITPDRHAAAFFGLVNVGVVHMQPGHTPTVATHTWLYLEPDFAAHAGEETAFIAAQRDLYEVETLADHALNAAAGPRPIVALVDGPLELWRRGGVEVGKARGRYASALGRMLAGGVLPAGYVDRPRSAPMVHTLALLHAHRQGRNLDQEDLAAYWPGVADAHLWLGLLRPGQRSPTLRIWTPVPPQGQGQPIPLAAFYLRLQGQALARVDIPLEAAADPAALDALHRHLLYQAHIVPGRAYPYILLRAHETALVTYDERRTLEAYLQRRLAEVTGQVRGRSAKQQLKDAVSGGRRRREGTP